MGVEPSAAMARKALRRVEPERLKVGRLADFEWEPASFDVVVSVSYIEHEPAPMDAATRMLKLLRPGGVSLHKTPNYNSWLRGVRGDHWSGYRFPEHLQYFTPESSRRLFETAGYEFVSAHANPMGDNFWVVVRKPIK